ncbi:Dabb family protein [Leifsonia sp. 21MFCrub1.1]|uniref:Dabb family protein n=1 Tax=Leifsonia sp. 21MFCrub1.1 TaxID=1798223 RepID=UPI0008928CE8|nr:Dabb family protein [Leifsonia sp. 21MFCrub1.1]SEB10575.1 Stress responsive A/B Barrel Domain [Leifsonia sp. 21MFCrub1.1]
MTIRHVVSWKLATTDGTERAEQAAEIKRGLESLPPVIPQLRSLEVGVSAVPGDDFDVVLISDFDDLDGLRAYVEHPAHVEVAAYIRSVVGARAAVDFEV